MKTNSTWKLWMMTLAIFAGLSACSKKEGSEPAPQPVDVKTITITELRALSTGAPVKLPEGRKFKGIVISDAAAKNIDTKTVVVQEATDKPGIIITFDAAQNFAMGDEIEVTASNQTLAQVNGEIVLQNVPAASAKKTGTGTITPRTVTIADLNTNKSTWGSTLVSINATDLTSADSKYKGTLTVSDASGSISATVLSGASFENTNLPASISKINGIIRLNNNNAQLYLRNTSDVSAGSISKSITIDFLNAVTDTLGNAPKYDDARAMYLADGFKTTPDVGNWGVNINGFYKPFPFINVAGDESITNGKSYFYLTDYFNQTTGLAVNATKGQLKGLRKVTVTFTYSKAPTANMYGAFGWEPYDVAPMTPSAQNKIQIGIGAGYADPENNNTVYLLARNSNLEDLFEVKSPEYSEAGKEYTMTYTMPTEADAKAKGAFDAAIAKYLKYPTFIIYNRCKMVDDGYYPVIIKKVVLGLE